MGKNLLPCRLLVFLLLLTIVDASSRPTLPQVEVNAVNAVLAPLKKKRWEPFESTDCNSKGEVMCNCSFDNHTTCRVTAIDLSNKDMDGPIAEEIGNLIYLQKLDLSENKLNGLIPNSLAKLSNISTLDLSENELNGSIPNSLAKLSNLSTLILYENKLEGPIPDFLGELKSLQFLDLSSNFFSGSIPPELGSLPSLLQLDLSDNLLVGQIPLELGNIFSLKELYLFDNRLSGHLPYQLGNLRNLTDIYLSGNEFTGVLPPSFAELKNLETFIISGNNFTGRIPDFIANWGNLNALLLMGNNFEWPFPDVVSSLRNLTVMFLSDLTGGHGGERGFLFPNISGMVSLKALTLRNCSLIGRIPEFIGQMPNLLYLDLSFNKLTGGIPTFVNHHKLKDIYLRGNELNGSLPGWLTKLTDSYVDVSENFFSNLTIPPAKISQNLNLFACCSMGNEDAAWQKSDYHCYNDIPLYDQLYINCGGEPVTINDTYYETDSQPYGRSTFFLNNNKSWGYSSMGLSLFEDQGSYIVNKTCNISLDDTPLYGSARISPISLKYYGFCLKNGTYTVRLHFAEIVLEAENIHKSKQKRVFDVEIQDKKVLSNFNIEEAAGGVNKRIIKEFNVSVDARLEIHLYWAGKGSILGPSACYGPLISAISVSAVSAPMESVRKLSAISIAGIVASALLFPILMVVCLWKLGWFGGKLHGEELKGIELLPGSFFNFQQIKAATQNFSSANKLGEGGFGSVYKGILPNGTAIAVKQLSAKSKQGIQEFVNEVGTISALRHPNLVRLLGCCAEESQLLLVYEHMENNSLHHALFGPEELRLRLTWPTRVKVCLGIAKGLAFLHEESKLKIVHRDIKPTNILLDKDLNAKISDFGFAKLYEGEMTHVITKIAGTTGYMAPEYAMRGLLTGKADVYSFGVVTLEIVSGKNSTSYRPNDGSVFLLDLAYVLREKGNLIELVDPTLGSDYSSEEAIKILELAMLCTNPSPTLRPNMSEVVKILEGKSKITSSPVSAPYSMDDFAMAKAIAGLSRSTHSGSTSQEETSNANTSQVVSKEIETSGVTADCSEEITM